MILAGYDLEYMQKCAKQCNATICFDVDEIRVYDNLTDTEASFTPEQTFELKTYLEARAKFMKEHNRKEWS